MEDCINSRCNCALFASAALSGPDVDAVAGIEWGRSKDVQRKGKSGQTLIGIVLWRNNHQFSLVNLYRVTF